MTLLDLTSDYTFIVSDLDLTSDYSCSIEGMADKCLLWDTHKWDWLAVQTGWLRNVLWSYYLYASVD